MTHDEIHALARADQQLAHVNTTLDQHVLKQVRDLLPREGKARTWAIVTTDIATQAGSAGTSHQFAVELLVAAAIRLVEQE